MENSCEFVQKAKDVSLQELRDRLAEFAEVRGWDQFHSPRNLLLALVSPYINIFLIPNHKIMSKILKHNNFSVASLLIVLTFALLYVNICVGRRGG